MKGMKRQHQILAFYSALEPSEMPTLSVADGIHDRQISARRNRRILHHEVMRRAAPATTSRNF